MFLAVSVFQIMVIIHGFNFFTKHVKIFAAQKVSFYNFGITLLMTDKIIALFIACGKTIQNSFNIACINF